MAITPGMRVGKYEVKKLLGQGGFGMVFAAHDVGLDRDCAMKFLLPEHTARPDILQRFLKEARSAAKIKHGGIVTVFECGVVEGAGAGVDGTAYIAMELLEGESLADRMRRGSLPIDHAIEISRQVASALAAAHAVGIIHRDLKPDNIYLVPDPATTLGERVKVLDFGIAKLADDGGGGGAKTSTHMIFGTPKYMSPEQCKSTAKVDERSDIYALGCILFEMVCGRPPFDGDAGELIAMQQLVAPPAAKSLRADLPESLDAAISAMLAKQPTMRPSTMTEVEAQLRVRASSVPAVASHMPIAPTMDPDAVTYPPPPLVPLSGVTPASALVPANTPVPAPSPFAPVPSSRPRVVWPYLVGGVVVTGIVIVVVAMGAKSTPAAIDARMAAAPGDAATVETPVMVKNEQKKSDPDVRPAANEPDPTKIYAMPATGSIRLGPAIAKVTIVDAGDYACPYCMKVAPTIEQIRLRYGQDVRVVVRPFVVHAFATGASVYACAAARQGEHAFAEFDRRMWQVAFPSGPDTKPTEDTFDDGTCWTTASGCPKAELVAKATGLNLGKLKRDLLSCADELSAARRDWEASEVRGIPAFFVNGRYLGGGQPIEAFALVIDQELAKANQRIVAGTRLERYYQEWVMDRGLKSLKGTPSSGDSAPPDVAQAPTDASRSPRGVAYKTTPPTTSPWRGTSDDAYCISGAPSECRDRPDDPPSTTRTSLAKPSDWRPSTYLEKDGKCYEGWVWNMAGGDAIRALHKGSQGFRVIGGVDYHKAECRTLGWAGPGKVIRHGMEKK